MMSMKTAPNLLRPLSQFTGPIVYVYHLPLWNNGNISNKWHTACGYSSPMRGPKPLECKNRVVTIKAGSGCYSSSKDLKVHIYNPRQ